MTPLRQMGGHKARPYMKRIRKLFYYFTSRFMIRPGLKTTTFLGGTGTS